MTDCRFSFAPFGEPGKVKMSELFRTPATGRDMTANGVTASEAASMPWTSPGACLWMRGATAYFPSMPSIYMYTVTIASASAMSSLAYLRRNVLLCESSATTRYNQIGTVRSICKASDRLLNSRHVVCNYLGLSRLPTVLAILLEDLPQRRDALVGQRIFARSI
jgi:hypothetical protein